MATACTASAVGRPSQNHNGISLTGAAAPPSDARKNKQAGKTNSKRRTPMGQGWMRVSRKWSEQLKISILLGMETKTERIKAGLFSDEKPQAWATDKAARKATAPATLTNALNIAGNERKRKPPTPFLAKRHERRGDAGCSGQALQRL
jgi:hypothetical protein